MSTGPKTGWGGKREGSGRKADTLTAVLVKKMLAKAKKFKGKYGEDLDDILLGMIYDRNNSTRDRLAGVKMCKDFTMAKISEDGPADKANAPTVYLP